MFDFARRFLGVGLALPLLAGCAQSSELSNVIPLEAHDTNFARLTPGIHAVTFTSFADGKLAFENGCFRLVKKQKSLAIIWPETAIVVRNRQIIRIEDHAARWSAGIGDRIRLGGQEAADIATIELSNEAARNCAGPYFVASNVIRRRRLF